MPINIKKQQWWILIVVIISFITISLFSISFFKEKLFIDTGYRAFYIINTEGFCFSNNRYILLFNQIIPLIGLHHQCSLKTFLQLFALADVPLFCFGGIAAFFLLRQKLYALIFPVGYIFFFGKFFFHIPDMELHIQAFFIYCLGCFFLSDQKLHFKSWVGITLLSTLASFGHPLGIPAVIGLLWLIVIKRGLRVADFIGWCIIVAILIFLRTQTPDTYESYYLNKTDISNILNRFDEKIKMIALLISQHPAVIILSIFICISLFNKRQFLMLFSLLGFIIGFTIIILLSNSVEYYGAYFLLLASIILMLSFNYIFIPLSKQHTRLTLVILLLITGSECHTIFSFSDEYIAKAKNIEKLADSTQNHDGSSKLIYDNSQEEISLNSTFEFSSSILLTTLIHPERSTILLPERNIPQMIQAMWPYMEQKTKETYFPDSFNITTSAQLIHYADLLYKEK